MSSCSKKKKAPSFAKDEELRLLENIYKERKYIENKETSKITNSEKDAAWARVCTCFNTNSLEFRSTEQLKSKYDNLKTKMKKVVAGQKNYAKGTGGGGFIPPADDPVIDILMKIVNSKTVVGIINPFDDDATDVNILKNVEFEDSVAVPLSPDIDGDLMEMDIIFEGEELVKDADKNKQVSQPMKRKNPSDKTINIDEGGSSNVNWSGYTPQKLRQTPSKKLRPTVITSLGNAKEEYFRAMTASIKEELQFKVNHECREQEKHAIAVEKGKKEIQLLDLEIKFKNEQVKNNFNE